MIRKPKIAVIGLKGLPALGGAATVGENIIEQLKGSYSFTVYSTSSHTNLKTGEINGYKQIVFKKLPFKKLNSLYYYVLSALHSVVFSNFNLVHLHHRDGAFIIPFLRLRYKVILTTHGIGTTDLSDKWNRYKWFFRIQENVFLKYANYIVTVSKRDYMKMVNQGYSHISYIPNGIKIPINNKDTYTDQFDIIFSAGRIVSFKGCHLMLKALNKLHFKGTVLIIGNLIDSSEYATEIKELSKELNITFKGLIKNKNELYSYIKRGKIFVFPSSVEAMSIMLLEAVACRIPVVASNIEANTDIFSDNEILFFEGGNIEDLADQIEISFNNYDQMIKRADAALLKAQNIYTWQNIAFEYKKIYKLHLKKDINT